MPAGGKRTLNFVVGYLPPGACVGAEAGSVVLDCGRQGHRQGHRATREPAAARVGRDEAGGGGILDGDLDGANGGVDNDADLASLARSSWAPQLVTARVANAPWVEREMRWHSYMLQATPTFDSYFNQTIIDQGNNHPPSMLHALSSPLSITRRHCTLSDMV